MTVCRSCKAPVRWVQMEPSGRAMPLDALPAEQGNVILSSDGEYGAVLSGELLTANRLAGHPLYLSHFATCPDAAAHRKPRPTDKEAA